MDAPSAVYGLFKRYAAGHWQPRIALEPWSRPVEFKPLQLDAADQQWLANHGALRVGIALGDHEPVDITNDRNQYQGLSADYLSIVRDKLGATVEVLGFRKRDQAVAELLAGKIDILTSASGFERGVEGITFSRST